MNKFICSPPTLFIAFGFVALFNLAQAQNVGINTTGAAANASALLDLNTGNNFATPNGKGLLVPNVALTGVNDASTITSPAASLLVYVPSGSGLTPPGYYYNSGTPAAPVWVQMGSAGNSWLITGNSNITDGVNFVGTLNNVPLNFAVNNTNSGRIDAILFNTFLGYQAGDSTSNTAINGTAVGYQALQNNTTGQANTAFGLWALEDNTTGTANVAVGPGALWHGNGNYNTAIGLEALANNTPGNYNTAVGAGAFFDNTLDYNTAIGYDAGNSNNGEGCIMIGADAGYYSSGNHNTIIGDSAGLNNQTNYNVFIGYLSGYNNGGGDNNTAMGLASLNTNNGGSDNTAIGANTLTLNNNGTGSTAVGSGSLQNNTDGKYNSALGFFSLTANTLGEHNVAIGAWTMTSNITASGGTALGWNAGYNNTAGYNTFLGDSAGYNNTTGIDNTYVGYAAGSSPPFNSVSNVVCLGYNSGTSAATVASNSIYLGNSSTANIYAQTTSITAYSDRRVKDNIKENVPGLAFITKLHPVTYNYNIHRENKLLGIKDDKDYPGKYDVEKITQSGFIAQQVDSAAMACNYDFNGVSRPKTKDGLYGLNYTEFVVPLVKAIQEQQHTIDSLKSQEAQDRADIAELKKMCMHLAVADATKP